VSDAARLHVFVLIDALGWPVVEATGFLSDVLPARKPVRTVLGYSSGAIPTLLTGRPPAEHGHWNLFYYDPEGSPFRWLRWFGWVPDAVLNRRVTRRLLKELGRRVFGLGPLFECCVEPRLLPWFNWTEKANIYAPGGIGGAPSIFDSLVEAGIPYRAYTYHRWSDAEILRRACEDIQQSDARFFFLYLSEVDAFLHKHCDEPARIAPELSRYEAALRRVFEAARRRDPEAGFTVISDHGMTPVRQHCDLAAGLSDLGLRMPDDYLAVYDSTMARFWFFTDVARRRIVERLLDTRGGRLLSRRELEDLGLGFSDRRYGDVVFLLDPGGLVASSGFNGDGWKPAGMHGYHPDDRYSDAVLLSDHEPPVPVRSIADFHRYMTHVTGLEVAV